MLDRVLLQYDPTIHANLKRVHNTYVNNHRGLWYQLVPNQVQVY